MNPSPLERIPAVRALRGSRGIGLVLPVAVAWLGACSGQHGVAGNPSLAPLATYEVRFGTDGGTPVADVRARLPVPDGVLLMYPEGAEEFASGWSHFVTHLEARDTMGRPVNLEPTGRDQWRVSGTEVVDLSYRVWFRHDREPHKWPFGVKEIAYVRPDFIFSTGKALFITHLEMPPASVRIEPPSGGRVLASWPRVPGGENVFRVSGPLELTESMIVAGSPVVHPVQVGNTRLHIVTTRRLASAAVVAEHSQRFLPAAAALFGATPPDTLLVLVGQDAGYVGGGAAFSGGVSLMFPEAPGPGNRARWGHVLDHEIAHLWIGYRLRYPDEAPEYWFSEGFTDYATWMLEVAHGLVSEDTLLSVIGRQIAAYRRQAGLTPMQAASTEKARYYDLIYSGGFLVALALDVDLRAGTDRERGLPDMLRAMYAEFGEGDPRYTAQDIARMASETCGCDLLPFFQSYVFGTEVLPVEPIIGRLGIVLEGDGASPRTRLEAAHAGTSQLRAAWLDGWRAARMQ